MASLQLALLVDPVAGPSLQELAHRMHQAQLRLSRLHIFDHGIAENESAAMRLEAESERELCATALLLSIPNQRIAIVGSEGEQRYWVCREYGNHVWVRPYRPGEDEAWDSLADDKRQDYEDAS